MPFQGPESLLPLGNFAESTPKGTGNAGDVKRQEKLDEAKAAANEIQKKLANETNPGEKAILEEDLYQAGLSMYFYDPEIHSGGADEITQERVANRIAGEYGLDDTYLE